MPSFGSGLAHALSEGAIGYGEGNLEERRQMLALAAQKRAEERANLASLAGAAGAGLDLTPAAPPTATGDSTGVPAVPDTIVPPKRPPLGTVGGYDISVPEGGIVDKTQRGASAKIEGRKTRLREFNSRLPANDPNRLTPEALDAVASEEPSYNAYIQRAIGLTRAPMDPIEQHRKLRQIDRNIPLRDPVDRTGPTPQKRATYVLQRAAALQKPTTTQYGVKKPGLAREEAERLAGEEYDRVNGVTTGDGAVVPVPPPPGSPPKLRRTTSSTAGAGGAGSDSTPNPNAEQRKAWDAAAAVLRKSNQDPTKILGQRP